MRAEEVDRYLVAVHAEHEILATTQTYSGDIYDWVAPASIPGSEVPPPFPLPKVDRPVLTELEAFPELRGPTGSIPLLRPTFSEYVRGTTGEPSLQEYIRHLPQGQPSGVTNLYAGFFTSVTTNGTHSTINQFPGTTEADTFTLLETAVNCPGTSYEFVGAALSRGAANFDGTTLRFNVEFATNGTAQGNGVGGWNTMFTGWIPLAGAPYGPGVQLTGISVVGGTQYESPDVYIFRNAQGWWIAHNGHWLGRYPLSLFDAINNGACSAHWYGEVHDATETTWTTNDMGLGGFASEGVGHASYFRDVRFYDSTTTEVAITTSNVSADTIIDSHCYTAGAVNSGANISSIAWFYLGGPGHTSSNGCN